MKCVLIAEKDRYALIQRGNDLQQFAVVSGLNKEAEEWDCTCSYYDFGKYSDMTKETALFKALDDFLERTDQGHISYERMSLLAGGLISGLIEDGEDEAFEYMRNVLEMSDVEARYFNLEQKGYKAFLHEESDYGEDVQEYRTEKEHYTPSSTNGDYGPSHPWDAPGMSAKDFI